MAVGGTGGSSGLSGAIEAGKAVVRVGADTTGLESQLAKAKKMVVGWGASIAAGGAGLLGLGAGILAPIAASFKDVLEHFDQFSKAADRTGATTEALSALGYAAEQSDASLEDVTSGVKFLQKAISEAGAGSQEAADALGKLGLKAEDLKGKSLEEQFDAIADGLAAIEDPADRTAAALGVLGRGGLALVPMLKDGAAGLKALRKEAGDVGAIVGGEDAKNATRIGDAINKSWTAVKNTFRAVGAALLPQVDTIEEFSNAFVSAVKEVRDFINENRQVILVAVGVGAALVAAGGALVGLGTALAVAGVAIGGLATAASAVGSVLAVVFSPVGLGIAALGVAAVAVAALVAEFGDLEAIGNTLGSVWAGIAETFAGTWKGVRDALKAGDLKLAFEVAVAGLDVVWKGFLAGLQVAWSSFKNTFLEGWYDLMTEIKVVTAKALKELGLSDKSTGILAAVSQGLFGKAIGGTAFAGAGLSEEEIRAADAKAKADRIAARAANDNAAATAAAAAQLYLLTKQQEAATAAGIRWWLNLFSGAGAAKAAGVAETIAGATRGTFGGQNLAQQFMGASGTTADKIEKNTKRAADGIDEMKGNVGGLRVE